MILAMLLALTPMAHAASPGSRPQVVGLKSGAAIEVRQPTAASYGAVRLIQPQARSGEDASIECDIEGADGWHALAGFFGRIAGGNVPVPLVVKGAEGGCGFQAAFGATPQTEKVLTLRVQRLNAEGKRESSSSSSISRRESADLSAGLSVIGSDAAGVTVNVPNAGSQVCSDSSDVSVRTLYRLKGWRIEGDPGFQADVAALRKAVSGGKAEDEAVVSAMADKRLRPGALGDVLGL
ncbi:MAG: hypothetical protein AB8H79_22870 [Myxococcota bacterium]